MSRQTIYRIRHATSHDLDACLALRAEAEQDLADSGIHQWTSSTIGQEVITALLKDGNMFVVADMRNEVVACLALAGPDLDFWRPDESVQPALYLYKMIIAGESRGTGLGDMLIDWCSQRAQQVGARWLRLDCWKTNANLHQLWRKRGFTHVDTREVDGRGSGALFQREAGTRQMSDEQLQNHVLMLSDDTDPARPVTGPVRADHQRDTAGEAAIWREAAELVRSTQRPGGGSSEWNNALSRASLALDRKRRELRDTSLRAVQ